MNDKIAEVNREDGGRIEFLLVLTAAVTRNAAPLQLGTRFQTIARRISGIGLTKAAKTPSGVPRHSSLTCKGVEAISGISSRLSPTA